MSALSNRSTTSAPSPVASPAQPPSAGPNFTTSQFVTVADLNAQLKIAPCKSFWKKLQRHWQTWVRWSSNPDRILFLHLGTALCVFLVNLIWTSYAINGYEPVADGYFAGILFQGSCSTTRKLDLWLHLLINILSSLLLWSSNFCMQILAAPTRDEVDKAHAEGKWFDIGIVSFRNLWQVNHTQSAAWRNLAISSTLLHLFWNSALFAAKPTTSYGVAYVTSDFLENRKPWNASDSSLNHIQNDALSFDRLNTSECVSRYLDPFTGGKDLVIVTTLMNNSLNTYTPNDGTSLVEAWYVPGDRYWKGSVAWICNHYETSYLGQPPKIGFCTAATMAPYRDEWAIGDVTGAPSINTWSAPVEYCLSGGLQDFDNMCGFYFSHVIMILVCILNGVQCFYIMYTVILQRWRAKPGLLVIGDAIVSFLKFPDECTKGVSMLAMADVTSGSCWDSTKKRWLLPQTKTLWRPPQQTFWYQAVSRWRWILGLTLCIVSVELVAAWLGIAVNSIKGDLIPTDAKSLGRYGLGQVYTFSIVQNIGGKPSNSTLLGCILFANVFQVVVNVVYQILLAQLTSMLVAREWLSYVCRPSCRKSVSSFSILIRKFRSSRVGKLFKISPDPLVSDRIQCQWIIEPFDNCRKLGLTSHWEAEIRKKFPNETSLLVAEAVLPEKLSDHELEKTSLLVAEDILPEGPSDHKLEKGDVLIKVNGELVTKFTRLDAILASSVRAGKLNLLVQRGGKDVKVELDVGYLPPGKTFRVSAPEGKQRSSYFLSLPLRYALPLTVTVGLLQWFISQTLFLVQVTNFNANGSRNSGNDGTNVGYSCLGLILAFVTFTFLVIVFIIASFQQYPAGPASMPLASTNSAAISAACHRPDEDTDCHLVPARWGVVSNDGIEHCCFTSAKDVSLPIPGHVYA